MAEKKCRKCDLKCFIQKKALIKFYNKPSVKTIFLVLICNYFSEDWMFLQYRAGDRYGSHCHQAERETWINIRCEENGEVRVF